MSFRHLLFSRPPPLDPNPFLTMSRKSSRRRRHFTTTWRRQQHLENSFNNLKQRVANSASQPELDLKPQLTPEEREVLDNDLLAWAKHYLPHHFKEPPSKMHIEVAAILDAASRSQRCEEDDPTAEVPS